MGLMPYLGGKHRLQLDLWTLVDARDYRRSTVGKMLARGTLEYREPFLGSGGVFLNTVGHVRRAWLNDKDKAVMCLWWAVWKWPDEFADKVAAFQTAPHRDVFEGWKALVADPPHPANVSKKTCITFALAKLCVHYLSFSGKVAAPTYNASNWRKYNNRADKIREAGRKLNALDQLTLTCEDFGELVTAEGNSFLYCDPPYYYGKRKDYPHSLTVEDHERLSRQLHARKQPWLLSYNDCDFVRGLYRDRLTATVQTYYGIAAAHNKVATVKELVISNQ